MSVSPMKLCYVGGSSNPSEEGHGSRSLLAEAAKKLNIELTFIPKGKIHFEISNERIQYSGNEVKLEEQDAFMFRDIAVLLDKKNNRRERIFMEMVMFAKYLNKRLGKVVFDEYVLSPWPEYNKIKNSIRLVEAGLPSIPTWIFFNKSELKKHIGEIEFPIIVKPANGARGQGVMKFETKEKLLEYLDTDPSPVFYPNMIQKYIDNDGDFRVVVLGTRVVVALKKFRGENSIVANMSQGNLAQKIEPEQEIIDLAIQAAQSLGMEFAGVDIIQDRQTGKLYILEVNLSPQIALSTQFSQVDIASEVMEYIIGKVRSR